MRCYKSLLIFRMGQDNLSFSWDEPEKPCFRAKKRENKRNSGDFRAKSRDIRQIIEHSFGILEAFEEKL